MIRATVRGNTYGLAFSHMRIERGADGEIIYPTRPGGKKCTACTAATVGLVRGSDFTIIAYGIAYCSIKDHFQKERGRVIALGRALKQVPEAAEELWAAYRERKKR